MMSRTVDPLTSFVFLTDNLPSWIKQIRSLSNYTSHKHEEFAAEYKRLLAHAISPKYANTPSFITTKNELIDSSAVTQSTPEITPSARLIEISPFEPGNKYLLANARRRRNPGTSVLSGASGPQKFRSKHMVIIYYDSFLQQQLEGVVKSIGSARNNLRKGRMARSLKQGLQLPSISRYFDCSNDAQLIPGTKDSTTIENIPLNCKPSTLNNALDKDAAFIQTDKQLESAQTLCETAAHQFLRDGDCTKEMESVCRKLESVLALARETVVVLEAEEEVQKAAEAAEEDVEGQEDERSSDPIFTANQNLLVQLLPSLNEKSGIPRGVGGGATLIEVDDQSDASSIEIDLSKLRVLRANRPRA